MKIRPKRLISILAALIVVAASAVIVVRTRSTYNKPILLEGTLVMPENTIAGGWILIRNGKISLVSESKPDAPDAVEVKTGGIIFPGLIDLHNHISYDVFPRWQPGHLFSGHHEWRIDPEFLHQVRDPYNYLTQHNFFCDMNTYGELRALAGGVTSILATTDTPCIRGLVRNLDGASGLHSFPDRDSNYILDDTNLPADVGPIKVFLASDRSRAFVLHLAEGIDAASLAEFDQLDELGLLTAKTVIVHGTALGPTQLQRMGEVGAALVWSPRSNIELYGQTADIASALDAGVEIALAPDWAVTGSNNLLDELRYAAQWNAELLSGRLSDEQLVRMATAIPAHIAGIDGEVGAIREGLYADLLVISGDSTQPYYALLQAQPSDVQLVLINGQPLYGAPDLMESFWNESELSEVTVGGVTKMVRLPSGSARFGELASKLQAVLASQGTSLAPID